MQRRPTIGLVAHDSCKPALLALARDYEAALSSCQIVSTENTGHMLRAHTKLTAQHLVESGPLGGDLQIASQIVEGLIDALVFLCDATQTHPHQNDINALLRISTLYDIPLATNVSTARLVLDNCLVDARTTETHQPARDATNTTSEEAIH